MKSADENKVIADLFLRYIESKTEISANESGPDSQVADLLVIISCLIEKLNTGQIMSFAKDRKFIDSCNHFDRNSLLSALNMYDFRKPLEGDLEFALNVNESDQSSNMQNATLQSAESTNFAVSIATYPDFHGAKTQKEILESFESDISPLIENGWKFEIKIGNNVDTEIAD